MNKKVIRAHSNTTKLLMHVETACCFILALGISHMLLIDAYYW